MTSWRTRKLYMGNRAVADFANKDASLLLDMLLAARDACAFVAGTDEAAFRASRLPRTP